jgi:hypothetical protein
MFQRSSISYILCTCLNAIYRLHIEDNNNNTIGRRDVIMHTQMITDNGVINA